VQELAMRSLTTSTAAITSGAGLSQLLMYFFDVEDITTYFRSGDSSSLKLQLSARRRKTAAPIKVCVQGLRCRRERGIYNSLLLLALDTQTVSCDMVL
jgi:hypothetical protein